MTLQERFDSTKVSAIEGIIYRADGSIDFEHPATIGCLTAMARSITGDPYLRVRWSNSNQKWMAAWMWGKYRAPELGPDTWTLGASEAEALVSVFTLFATHAKV